MFSKMTNPSRTLSVMIEKIESSEEMTLTDASLEDAGWRRMNPAGSSTAGPGTGPGLTPGGYAPSAPEPAISNEDIREGDLLCGIYRVRGKVETGAMGTILKVFHENWQKELAVKRPKPHYFAEAGIARRRAFIAECENWIDLGLHPHIVSCYYVREIGGVPSVFSEWMDGGSLADRISDGTLYSGTDDAVRERILDLAIQSARGLKYAHERGLLHQDIKPDNLLLSKDWDLKVADFGIARAKTHLRNGNAALYGYSLGYCPREQIEGEEPEAWMDVYAWAVTLLEMYAGGLFWETGAELFRLIDKEGPEALHYLWRVSPPQKLISEFLRFFGKNREGSSVNPGVEKPDFTGMEALLLEIYKETTGREYPHPALQTALDTSDSLNNRALSFYDLGKTEIAERYWQESAELNPMHKDTCLNYGLYLWRNAKCSDQEVLERLLYFADLCERYHDDAGIREFYRIIGSFWDECGCEDLAKYGSRIDIRDRLKSVDALPQQTPPGNDEKVYLFALESRNRGSRHEGMVLRIRERDTGRIIRTVDVEPIGYEEGLHGKAMAVYPTLITDYARKRLYFASETLTGRSFVAADYDMPMPPEIPLRMGYQATSPVPFRQRALEDRARGKCEKAFREAMSKEDLSGMLSAYDQILDLPLSENHTAPVEMSRAIMERCLLPGVYDIVDPGSGMIIGRNRVWDYEEGEPRPAEVYGVFPIPPEETDLYSQNEGGPENLQLNGGNPRPGDRKMNGLTMRLKGRKAPKIIPRLAEAVRAAGRHIARVLAVSNLGDTLVLELRDGEKPQFTSEVELDTQFTSEVEAPQFTSEVESNANAHTDSQSTEGDYYIVWALRNGRRMTELLHGIGENPFEAVVLDKDDTRGPFRVYLWRPYTRDIRYFEEDYWGRGEEIEFNLMRPPFPLPENLRTDGCEWEEVFIMDEERREWEKERAARDPDPLIKSLLISENEDKLIMIMVKKEEWGDSDEFFLYRQDEEEWEKVFYGEAPERSFVSKDLSYVLNGIRNKLRDPSWEWTLWNTGRPQKGWDIHKLYRYSSHREPLWYMKEFLEESRIRSLSDDLCSLLDGNGRPVYAVCWRFE